MEFRLNPLTEVVARWRPLCKGPGRYVHDFVLRPDIGTWCEDTFGRPVEVVVVGPHVVLRLPDREGLAFRLRWR